MNKLFKVLGLAVMLVICGQAMAQTDGAIFLGASFPMKNYAAFDGFSDFALVSTEADEAGAGTGFNLGLKWIFNVGVEGLGVMLSVDGFYNGPNKELKNVYRENESFFDGQILDGSFKYNSTPKIFNFPAMLGVNYTYNLNPNFGLFVEAGAGGSYRLITNMETVNSASILGVETKVTTIQEYDGVFTFAYQAGLGIEVANNLVVGCSFYDLGGAAVNGEQTIKTKPLNDNVTNTTYSYHKLGNVHPIMILCHIGFSL